MTSAKNPTVEALAALSWETADVRLAEAWSEQARLEAALSSLRRSLKTRSKAPCAASDAALLLRQALEAALRARGLGSIGRAGAVQRFDPGLHALESGEAEAGAEVRVVAPGVQRVGDAREVVRRAAVRRVRRRTAAVGSAAR